MTLRSKRIVIALLGVLLLLSLLLVQGLELMRARRRTTVNDPIVPARSRECVRCHAAESPRVVLGWKGGAHGRLGVGCVACHEARRGEPDGFEHYGEFIATPVTPRDCGRCHREQAEQFGRSSHARAGAIDGVQWASAKAVMAGRDGPPGAKARSNIAADPSRRACESCHGSVLAVLTTDGRALSAPDFETPTDGSDGDGSDGDGSDGDDGGQRPAAPSGMELARTAEGMPQFRADSWPNAGIGRLNLDGSAGSCAACHGNHGDGLDEVRSARRCLTCHRGQAQPQRLAYSSSQHAAEFNTWLRWQSAQPSAPLRAPLGVLGRDYVAAPSCATCHMSGHRRNGGQISHQPGRRLGWSHRPLVSVRQDTDADGRIVGGANPKQAASFVVDTWQDKRQRMRRVCSNCHGAAHIDAYFRSYDALIERYDERYAKPLERVMQAMLERGLRTAQWFDEPIEWQWSTLWQTSKKARCGAAMMAPAVSTAAWSQFASSLQTGFIAEAERVSTVQGIEMVELDELKAPVTSTATGSNRATP